MRASVLAAAVCVGALAAPAGASAFVPNDPLAARQWYLAQDHAFDQWDAPPPALGGVRVAIVDSGIDASHPEFAGRIFAERSFVGGSPLTDEVGHGTFVAGEIAAATNDGTGIAGMAPAAQLIVAKVVTASGSIPPSAEAAAIVWAVNQGARVLNLSLGGVRDPGVPAIDNFSSAEAAAVRYAVAHRVVVVSAIGNGDQAPSQPWPYASYPAALPHVIGVSALDFGGGVPPFSNRDPLLNDIAAPGVDIFSTLPRALTALRPECLDQGYSDCGPSDYLHAQGTSFAAPQVSAAAAVLLGIDPTLQPDQVSWLLERSADDVNASTGCSACTVGRDPLTGWGRLDVQKAVQKLLAREIPPPDRYEPNNDAGAQAAPLSGRRAIVAATVDSWDNPIDVYKVYLTRRQMLDATLAGPADIALLVWKPGTSTVIGPAADRRRNLAAHATGATSVKRVSYVAPAAGWYYVEVKAAASGFAPYTLTVSKRERFTTSTSELRPS